MDWRLFLTRWRGFGWPTASSTPEAPRERVIIELSEPVDRQQGIGIGALLTQDIGDNFGVSVLIDACTFRAEHPCFLPLVGAMPFYLLGDALDVPRWLEQIPPPRPPPRPPSADEADIADLRMRRAVADLGAAGLLLVQLANSKGYGITCPWQRTHTTTDAPGTYATALLFPSEANGWRGAFRCLHSHCSERRLADLLAVLATAKERVSS